MSNMGFNEQSKKQMRFYVTTGAALFTGLALFETLKYQSRIVSNQRKTKLVNEGHMTKIGQLRNIPKGQLVMVSGTVDTADQNPIKTVINRKSELLALRLLYKQCVYSNESYDFSKKDYNINLREVLKGSDFSFNNKITLNEGVNSVLVKNIDKIDFSSALDVLRWETHKKDLNVFENMTAFFLAILRGVATVGVQDRNVTFLRGIDVGTREVEAGIKIGASLTVLGTLGVTTEGIVFIQPSALFKQRLSFLHELNTQFEQLCSKRNVWLAAFIIGAVYVGRRTYKYIKSNDIKMPWQKSQRAKATGYTVLPAPN